MATIKVETIPGKFRKFSDEENSEGAVSEYGRNSLGGIEIMPNS